MSTKIHIVSDIHIEFADLVLPETNADIIILAGDIGVGINGLQWAQQQASQQQKPCLYIPGNHEFYRHDLLLLAQMQQMAESSLVTVMNQNIIVHQEVRFLGCMLWTDFEVLGIENKAAAMDLARTKMSDFSLISLHGQRFTPEDSVAWFSRDRDWLIDTLSQPFSGKTVVITHHAPSRQFTDPKFTGQLMNAAFKSNLDYLMADYKIDLWIHGHTHHCTDYTIANTRVFSNQRGYPFENITAFDAAKVIDI